MIPPLLSIQPHELKFPFELKKQVSCSLQLVNATDKYVAFKIKTTSPKKYSVQPIVGVLLPEKSCDITVTMQAQREAPPLLQCKDKFLVQSALAPDGIGAKEVSQNLFNKDNREVYEIKLRVVYLPPLQPPSPVPESAEEGLSIEVPTFIENDINHFGLKEVLKERNELRVKLTEAMENLKSLNMEKNELLLQNQRLQQDLVDVKNAGGAKMVMALSQSGFSIWVVLVVGFFSVFLGYIFSP